MPLPHDIRDLRQCHESLSGWRDEIRVMLRKLSDDRAVTDSSVYRAAARVQASMHANLEDHCSAASRIAPLLQPDFRDMMKPIAPDRFHSELTPQQARGALLSALGAMNNAIARLEQML